MKWLNIHFGKNLEFELFLASCHIIPLLITVANSLDSYQDQRSVIPDLDPNQLTLWKVSLKESLKKVNFISRWQQKHEKLPSMQRFYSRNL